MSAGAHSHEQFRRLAGLDALGCAALDTVERAHAAAAGASGAGAPGGHTPFELPGDRTVWGRDRALDVSHLRLELDFDLPRRRVQGVATTTFRPRRGGLRIAEFDARELEVTSVTDGAGRALDFEVRERTLAVDLGRAQPAGRELETVVHYHCRPRRGLYFNQPEAAYPDRPAQIWTQGQAEDSPYYFPCVDYPGEKYTTEVLVTVPDGWFALSNGTEVGAQEDRRRRRTTYHWRQDRPHPAYLVTVVAGIFAAVEEDAAAAGGVPVAYYGPHGTEQQLRNAFGRTPDMIRFFSDHIGVPYPWTKYATVAVGDFIFGGMENTSATTMTDTLLHDDRAHPDMRDPADSITAHELAHQWFGDLVTCREWAHGWLNESFATYGDVLYTEHARGWDAARYQLYQNARLYRQEDAESYRRPLVQQRYTEPIDIFDRHLYERGSVVLDMLRTNLGDEGWRQALRHYVTRHAERDAVTADLQRAVEEATGRNMDWFFDQWVWKGGHPEFRATYQWDEEHHLATVRLEQTQPTDDPLTTAAFRTPLSIAFMEGERLQTRAVEVTEREHAFVFPLARRPRFVAIDPGNRVLKTLEFDPGEEMRRAQLTDDPQLMGRIEAAGALATSASPSAVEALAAVLADADAPEILRAEVASALGTVGTEAARDALVAAASAEPSRVRRHVAAALGTFPADETAARALWRLLSRRGDASYYVQSQAAAALGATRTEEALRCLPGILGRAAHNDVITAGALTGLGQTRDARALPPLLDHTRWGVHQNARRAAVDALGVLGPHLEAADRLRVRERLEELLDDGWLRVQLAAVGALGRLGDRKAQPALRRAADRALDGRLARSARVAVRILDRDTPAAEVQRLRDSLEALQRDHRTLQDRFARLEARLDGAPAGRGARGGGTGASKTGANKTGANKTGARKTAAQTGGRNTSRNTSRSAGSRSGGNGGSGGNARGSTGRAPRGAAQSATDPAHPANPANPANPARTADPAPRTARPARAPRTRRGGTP